MNPVRKILLKEIYLNLRRFFEEDFLTG